MNQIDAKHDNVSENSENDFTQENNGNETLNKQSEQSDSEEIDNVPIESIGSYGRIDPPLEDKDSASTDYSPSET